MADIYTYDLYGYGLYVITLGAPQRVMMQDVGSAVVFNLHYVVNSDGSVPHAHFGALPNGHVCP